MNAAGCIHTPVWQAKPYSTKGRDPNWGEEEEEEEEKEEEEGEKEEEKGEEEGERPPLLLLQPKNSISKPSE